MKPPLCIVVLPFGKKLTADRSVIDFDEGYADLIESLARSRSTVLSGPRAVRCHVLHAGRSSQLGGSQSSRRGSAFAPGPLLIDQQRESFQETEVVDRPILFVRLQSLAPCPATGGL
jgi:hypothetical protein